MTTSVGTCDSGRIGAEAAGQRAQLAPVSPLPDNGSSVGARAHAAVISVLAPALFTLLVQAALTFQKYRFDKGLMLGTTMASISWYENIARRKNFRPSRLTLFLVATVTTVLIAALQQGARGFAAGLPLTHS